MQEYVSDAVVLLKQPSGEQDGRYALFTKRFGKIIGRAKSSRKITSKLSGHLEPGNVVKVRFIEQKGIQIVDALKTTRVPISLGDLALLAELTAEMESDASLWDQIVGAPFSWEAVLRTLGWDPAGAVCIACGALPAGHFFIPRQEFFCSACIAKDVSKTKADKVSLIITERLAISD